jgi:Domain of unknown function (DUF5666)
MKFSSILSSKRLAAHAAVSALVLLSACGGGGGSEPVTQTPPLAAPTNKPLSVTGTVTGFGSIIIDGVRYDDSQAKVSVDMGDAQGRAAALGDVKLGMSVDAKVENGKLTDVTLRAALAGPVSSIDIASASFRIYGQTVKIASSGATPTLFEGVAGLAGLALNDRVEVHGIVDAGQAIVATRVERKPRDAGEPAVRLGGAVAGLDSVARSFRLGDLTVDFNGASVTPVELSLANGQQVTVFGDAVPANGRFLAKTVRIKSAEDGAPLAIGGRITTYGSIADFTVAGVRVNAQDAALEGGTAAELALGLGVAVEGRMTAGVLKADKLRIIKTSIDALASLKGEVSDFLSLTSFKLRGTAVDASAAVFENGRAADLGNGAYVSVRGVVRGDTFRAERVEFLAPPAAQPVKITGELRDWEATARLFKLVAMSVRVVDATLFEEGSLDRLANGRRVSVTGTPDSQGVIVASKITLLPDFVAPTTFVAGGRAYDVAASSFKLPGVTVTHNSHTVFEGGTSSDVANGVLVYAKGRYDAANKALFATWVEVVKGDAPASRVAGAVGDFVSAADFRIGGQRVDASNAEFVEGQSSGLANGVIVMATGSLVERNGARVFVATKLRFM